MKKNLLQLVDCLSFFTPATPPPSPFEALSKCLAHQTETHKSSEAKNGEAKKKVHDDHLKYCLVIWVSFLSSYLPPSLPPASSFLLREIRQYRIKRHVFSRSSILSSEFVSFITMKRKIANRLKHVKNGPPLFTRVYTYIAEI